jgi:ubiquitin-conjugating enzyme E2 Z
MNTNKTTMRIIQDIYDFNKNKPEQIYLYIDKSNIMIQYALIMGPSDTPYFGGYFFFEIKYPDDYPKNSPSVQLLTINNNVRFNPNLYENGKVCLSILGTWNGPSWSPVMNIRLVLESIRSLLGQFPIQNEPGFEYVNPNDISSIEYNQYIIYNTYKLAIIDVLNNKFKNISDKFVEEIKNEFNKNKKKLLDDLESYNEIYKDGIVESRIYFMKRTKLEFSKIIKEFKLIKL